MLTRSLEIKMWIGHIELLDAKAENFLQHVLGVIGLEFQPGRLQEAALIRRGVLVNKAEVDVPQLESVHFLVAIRIVQLRTSE